MSILQPIIFFAVLALLIFRKSVLNFIFACLKIKRPIPPHAVNAEVVAKDLLKNQGGAKAYVGMMILDTLVTFEFENRKNVTLYVPQKIYDSLSIGSKGKLAYAGSKFECFIIDEANVTITKGKRHEIY